MNWGKKWINMKLLKSSATYYSTVYWSEIISTVYNKSWIIWHQQCVWWELRRGTSRVHGYRQDGFMKLRFQRAQLWRQSQILESKVISLVTQTLKNLPALHEMQETWFHPRVGKIPWRRGWQPTPVFLPGGSHGQRSLAGYSLCSRRTGHGWVTNTHTHTHTGSWSLWWAWGAPDSLGLSPSPST